VTRRRVLLAALASLAGCANLPAPDAPAALPAPTDAAFQVSGRFAVRIGNDGGSGRILWDHTPATDDLTISSPIGQGLARIVRESGIYTLTTSDNRKATSADPDKLTEDALGWGLPISGLPFWLRGRPQPGPPAEARRDPNAQLAELRQAGWVIEYQSYHAASGLPERMRVRRENLDLRLVLEEWTTR
jgi:outer membrane lipoprotein LolB